MKNIFGRVALGLGLFVACTTISLLGWYVAANMALATAGPIMGSGGRDFSSGEQLAFIVSLILPLIIFPVCAWFFRKSLGTPLSILLGSSLIILPVMFFSMIDFLRFLDRNKYEQPADGAVETVYHDGVDGDLKMFVTYRNGKVNGDLIRICLNGNIKYYGAFEDGIKTGIHFEIENCRAPFLTKLTTYGPDEKILDMKKFEQALWPEFVHSFVKKAESGEDNYYLRYRWSPDKQRYYLATENISFAGGDRELNREYDESGELILEKQR